MADSVHEAVTDSPVMERVTEKSIDDAITRALEAMSLNPLKPKQLEVVRTFMSARDVCVAPNWLRKICYLCYSSTCI